MCTLPMYVTVETEQGTLRGQEKTSEYFSHKRYYSFQGVPYAKPPLGSLRFKAPEEPEPWSGVRDCLKEGNDCVQLHMLFRHLIGSEDCLYLNVYTPELGKSGKPVMVWIHGGGFNSGSGSTELYGPDYLMEEDIVLVTINYRVGVLGFLCLEHPEVPGNAGLKDQLMALRWVQKNIVKFSGDPNNVTIFGESAGGASVHYHLLSPLSKGLFHQAIIQSGSAFNPWAYNNRDNAIDRGFRLGKKLGCNTHDTDKLLQFLRQVPADQFPTAAVEILKKEEITQNLILPFTPCVEVPANSDSFLPQTPRELLKQGLFTKVPVIIGSTSSEGLLYLQIYDLTEENLANEDSKIEKFVPQNMGLPVGSNESLQVAKELKKNYFGDKPVSMETMDEFVAIYGDILFDVGIDDSLRLQIDASRSPVYAYEFTFCMSQGFLKTSLGPKFPSVKYFKGVGHGDDMSFLFSHYMEGLKKPTEEDEKFFSTVCKIWTTFAKTGNPNCDELETNWQPVQKDNYCYLDIGNELKMHKGRVKECRMRIWQQLYDKHPPIF